MSDIQELTNKILKFRSERDWAKFHNPKDVSLSLVLEIAELLEHFQWKNGDELEEYLETHKEEVGDEIADIAIYLFGLVSDLDLDLKEIIEKKMEKNAIKYPVDKAKGTAKKYTEL